MSLSYRLTDDEVTDFAMNANNYVKLEVPYSSLVPVKPIKECYVHKWYVSTEFDGPQSSKDGRDGYDVRTARTENSANVSSLVYTFEIPRVEVTMAQDAGVPIWSENVGNAHRKMNANLCNWIMTGTNAWDKVAFTGLYTGGTIAATALDAVKWDTPPAPINHMAAGFNQLYDYGFDEGDTWIMSSNLNSGIIAKYGAGDPSMKTMTGDYGVDEMIFLQGSASSATPTTRMNLFPMGTPAGDEATWVMLKKDPNVVYWAEVMPPTTTIKPELDFRRQTYHGRIEARGTLAVVQPTGIVYEEQADLV